MTETENNEVIIEENDSQEVQEVVTTPQTIGALLREKREEKHYSIRDIAKATKISTTMLELLESDQLDKLPNKAYVSGYVKSYSKELGIDSDEALEVLNNSYCEPSAANGGSAKKQNIEMPVKVSIPALITVFGCVILITMAAFYFKNRPAKEEVVVKAPTANITPKTVSAVTPLQSKEAPKQIEEPKKEAPEVKPVAIKKEAKKKEEKKVEKKRKFSKISGPLFSVNAKDSESELKAHIPQGLQTSLVEGKQNITIKAVSDNVWMTYKKDDQKIRKFSIKKGNSIIVTGDTVRMFIGNIKAAKVFLNNKLLNTPSRSGVKSLIFPAKVSTKYKLPLFVYLKSGKVITSDEYIKLNP